MKNILIFTFSCVLGLNLSTQKLFASFPENNLYLEDRLHRESTQMTEAKFLEIIDQVGKVYKPIVEAHGAQLIIDTKWEDPTVNAYAEQIGDVWRVTMFGGLARRPEVTDDGFALVVCHELGHHLGGFPFYEGRVVASEGQADYFASQACARKVWANDIQKNADARMSVDPIAKAKCNKVWDSEEDQEICYRTAMAGYSLADLLSILNDESRRVSFATFDPRRLSVTQESHPPGQCRLDTYLAGALCDRKFSDLFIPGKNIVLSNPQVAENAASLVSCTTSDFYDLGSRPRCWFAPTRPNMIQTSEMKWEEVAGNGNGIIEPGEAFNVSTQLTNRTDETYSNLSLAFRAKKKGVVTIHSKSRVDVLKAFSKADQSSPFVVYFDQNLKCGDDVNFDMELNLGKRQGRVEMSKPIGNITSSEEFKLSPKQIIPDMVPAGILSPQFLLDSIPARAVVLKATFTHRYRSELRATLIAPTGESFDLDVKSAKKIQGSDSFTLTTSLKWNGKIGSGIWALKVSDVVGSDEGTLDEWSLQFERASCEATAELTKTERVALLGL